MRDVGIPLVAESIRAGIRDDFLVKRYNLAYSSMRCRDKANAVCVLYGARLRRHCYIFE